MKYNYIKLGEKLKQTNNEIEKKYIIES